MNLLTREDGEAGGAFFVLSVLGAIVFIPSVLIGDALGVHWGWVAAVIVAVAAQVRYLRKEAQLKKEEAEEHREATTQS